MSPPSDLGEAGRRARGLDVEIRSDGRGSLKLHPLPEETGGKPEDFAPPVALGEMAALMERLEGQVLEPVRRGEGESPAGRRHVRAEAPSTDPAVDLKELSRKLFDSVFRSGIAAAYSYELGAARERPEIPVRLRLVMDPSDPEVAPYCTLPWELLTFPGQVTPLAMNPLRSLVRALKAPHSLSPPPPWPQGEPLRVLVAGASPPGEAELDLEAEVRAIREAGEGYPMPAFELLVPATAVSLRDRLQRFKPHVIHLMSHGDFDPESVEGYLLLAGGDGGDGGEDRISSSDLARLLAGLPGLLLVVLNACRGAQFSRRGGLDPWSGVAQTLVREGVPAVIAHQFPISDRAAIAFSGGLYGRLMAGEPLEAAVAEGRQAISTTCRGSLEWVTPVLYTRFTPNARQDPLPSAGSAPVRAKVRDLSWLITAKTEGFVGREWFFERLTRFREHCRERPQGGYFVVYGDPGIGKTSLLAETVRRLGSVHHFNIRRRDEAKTETFLENLCAQMVLRFGLPYPVLPQETTRDGGTLAKILGEVSARIGPDGPPEVFAVDALDEAESIGLPGVNPLFLPSYLPPRIVFLLTSQRLAREPELRCELDVLNIDSSSPENQADIVQHLRQRFPHPKIQAYLAAKQKPEAELLERLIERSEGNFMYLHCVLTELEQKGPDFPELGELPVGLDGYYKSHWERMRVRDGEEVQRIKVKILLALAVTTEPMSPESISGMSGVADQQTLISVLREWRPFLRRTASKDKYGKFYFFSLYHDSFRGFLLEQEELRPELVSFRQAHRRAMEHLAQGRQEDGA